ncbi:glycine receptor subunit alpha-4-like isoform X1 [Macrobrachium rosenbergii]|uniref:glycine receptor subunit alpha-4-like isoform X1 n=1 Tax=Macrobrachium rosenbergii TaxID=79674 RepID=UPI0034D69E3B
MVPNRIYFGLVLLSLSAKRTATETIHEYRSSRRYPGLGSELLKLDQLFRVGHSGQYDRRQTPAAALGIPTRVQIEMYIRSFGSVNPIQMEYTVDLYLHQRWLEVRFLNNTLTRPLDLSDPILVKMLWKPEVYFPNAKDSDFQYVTVPNVMLRIHPDGSILYILRLKLTFSCMMDLSHYPLDKQTCYIQLASFVKTTRELELVWYEDPLKMYKNLKLPQFQIKGLRAETCTQSFHIGNYSCLQAAFELRRNVGYHLVQSYLPTSLIVVVSWVSFWLDVDAIPSRVTLGVTTFLTVCSESTAFRDKMPMVSYVKALDIWMGSCTAFVFLALVEFTAVTHLARHHRRFVFWDSHHGQRAYVYNPSRARQREAQMHSKKSDREMSFHPPAASTSGQKYTAQRRSPVTHSNSQATDDRRRTAVTNTGCVDGNETTDSGNAKPIQDQLRDRQADSSRLIHLYHAESNSIVAYNKTERVYGVDHPRTNSRRRNDSDLAGLPYIWQEKAAKAKRIDVASRAIFPALFLFFNIAYWTYYDALS